MPSQGCTEFEVLAGQKGADLSRFVRARIVMVHNDSSSLVRFSNFSEDFRQTNGGVPLRIDRPTLLKRNSRHTTSFAEEIGDHLLRRIWLVLEDPHGRFLFFSGSYA